MMIFPHSNWEHTAAAVVVAFQTEPRHSAAAAAAAETITTTNVSSSLSLLVGLSPQSGFSVSVHPHNHQHVRVESSFSPLQQTETPPSCSQTYYTGNEETRKPRKRSQSKVTSFTSNSIILKVTYCSHYFPKTYPSIHQWKHSPHHTMHHHLP
jgi:hypothetical protein